MITHYLNTFITIFRLIYNRNNKQKAITKRSDKVQNSIILKDLQQVTSQIIDNINGKLKKNEYENIAPKIIRCIRTQLDNVILKKFIK